MRTLILFVATSAIFGQQLAEPTIAHVLSAGRLQAIIGIPGAARFSTEQPTTRYTGIVTASNAQVSLLLAPDTATWRSPQASETIQLLTRPRAAAISPNGSWFAIATADHLLTTYHAAIAQHTYTPSDLDTSADAIAIADNGTLLVSNNSDTSYVTPQAVATTFPTSVECPLFAPGSDIALASSTTAHAIVQIAPNSGVAIIATLPDITAPTSLALSADASTLWLSHEASPTLTALPLRSGQLHTYDISPGRLIPTGTPGVFLWATNTLLDTTRTPPETLLIAPEAAQQ